MAVKWLEQEEPTGPGAKAPKACGGFARWALAGLLCLQPGVLMAQSTTPQPSLQNRFKLQGPGESTNVTVSRNALNLPCLEFEAVSRAHVINPNVYDHVVSAYNRCVKPIKVRVCYYGTDHCIQIEAKPMKRTEGVLGIYPSMQYFRYSWTEMR